VPNFVRGPARLLAFGIAAVTSFAQQPAGSEAVTVLKNNCQPCHNDSLKSSGLSVTSREALATGGNRGTALKGLLLEAVEQTGALKMPPGRKLPEDQIATLRTWLAAGAPWPKEAQTSTTNAKPKGRQAC
jgi:hypothetical protein